MIYSLGEKKPSFDADSVWIADSADLIGDVVLNKDVSVWFNVTMRGDNDTITCLLYTSPSPRDRTRSRMPSSA